MNYYEHHLGDYLRDTAHLTILEDGAYRRLIDAYYIKEQPLPKEVRDCYRLVRAATKPERDAVNTVLKEFFSESADGWRHKRCDAEIARFNDKQEKARRSANARWGNNKTQSDGNANASTKQMRTHGEKHANALQTQSDGNAPSHQSPVTSHQTPDKTIGVVTGSGSQDHHSVASCERASDDFVPDNPARWIDFFISEQGLQVNPASVHDRKANWPILTRWCQQKISIGQIRAAITHAQATAKEPIANLIPYIDRVLASMQVPAKTSSTASALGLSKHGDFEKRDYKSGEQIPDWLLVDPADEESAA